MEPSFRSEPVTRAKWESFFDEQGVMVKEQEMREAVYSGGAAEEVRADVWKYLFGYYRFVLCVCVCVCVYVCVCVVKKRVCCVFVFLPLDLLVSLLFIYLFIR